jgi:hypothetical protein
MSSSIFSTKQAASWPSGVPAPVKVSEFGKEAQRGGQVVERFGALDVGAVRGVWANHVVGHAPEHLLDRLDRLAVGRAAMALLQHGAGVVSLPQAQAGGGRCCPRRGLDLAGRLLRSFAHQLFLPSVPVLQANRQRNRGRRGGAAALAFE